MALRYLRRIVSVVSFLLLIGAGAGLVAFTATGGKLMSVQTGSMEPAISKGGLIAVRQSETNTIKTGDVITYVNPADNTQTITHRVTGYRQSIMSGGRPHFITKGDANTLTDRPVPESAVVGKVVFSMPYAGYAIDSLRTPIGLLALVYLPAIIIIVYELRRLIAYYRTVQPYSLRRLYRTSGFAKTPMVMAFGSLSVLALVFASALPAFAAINSSVSLTGNTISTAPIANNPQDPPANETECDNATDTSVHTETNQNATSGNASASNNTNGGGVSTGNASNQNSTDASIDINNRCG